MTTDEPAPATSAHARPAPPEGLAAPAYAPASHAQADGEHESDRESEQDADGEAEEDDDADPKHDDQGKGKGKDVQQSEQPDDQQPQPQAPATAAIASAGDWQAVYSPAHGAYYFYNTVTQQTTWTNPLQPAASSSTPEASSSAAASASASDSTTPAPAAASLYALQEAAVAQGIDPSLAYLDPSLAGPSGPGADTFTAKFNARTGAFTRPDGRDPTHLSEYERAKRMSMAYFDVGQWEQDLDAQHEQEQEAGKKRKRPTKKDLVRPLPPLSLIFDESLMAV
ncbi:hypothetical protein EIP86_009348 [Pleurotus ostreatoroseus]|nr:hypothetical protein EIP86_009348 [Pleurotus ostreatoroseus]